MSEREPVPDPHDEDDDFAVWPFQRQLVDPLSRGHQPIVVRPPAERGRPDDTLPSGAVWVPPRQRRSAAPARIVVPLALATFFATIAGAAAIANRGGVQNELKTQVEPAAQAAPTQTEAAPAKAKAHATPVTRRAKPTLFVPDVVGLDRKAAVKQLKRKKFHVRVRLAKGAPGTVIEQTPRAATEVRRAGAVLLIVGREKRKAKPKPDAAPVPVARVIVAGVVGLTREDAVRTLENEGLTPAVYVVPAARPSGTVVAQAPAGGVRLESGSSVRINVAR